MRKITVKTKSGRFVTRNAEIIDRIDGDGRQYSIALSGNATYYVSCRDADGIVWSVK